MYVLACTFLQTTEKKSICLPRAANPAMSAPAKGLSFGPDGRSGRV